MYFLSSFTESQRIRNCQEIDGPLSLLIHALEGRTMSVPSLRHNVDLLQFCCIKKKTKNKKNLLFLASQKAVIAPGFLSCTSGLVVQYSNDNGILWHLLRELDFMSFLEPQIISIDLPREAKTPATAFRWWQPQHGESPLSPTSR